MRLFYFAFLSILSANAFANGRLFILNNSEADVEITIYGDACFIFDEGAFSLVPCDKQTLKAGETYQWDDTRGMSNFLRYNTWIVPVFRFSRFGLTYICKVDSQATELTRYIHAEANQLSATDDHYLELLKDYGYFRRPHIGCNLTTCINPA